MNRTLALACTLSACASSAQLEGRLAGLDDTLEQAERNGAYVCAPRELALGHAHVDFARDEIAQGNAQRANDHYIVAASNARAALHLSPADRCAPREVAIVRPAAPGDSDGDGFPDDTDSCPDEPEDVDGFEDSDGCPDGQDTDADGVPDRIDLCPTDPEDADGQQDSDGCPDPDDDLDGIPDEEDRCRTDPEDRDGWRDEDGCPDPDNDGDSLLDTDDLCPDEPGPEAARGCPRVYENVVVENTRIRITQKVHFATNRARILPDSFGILDTVAQVMRDFPEIRLEIQGHTDSRGSDRHNERLSDRRAAAVLDYLIGQGILPSRMVSRGYGEARPIESNTTRSGRAANRRVELVRTDDS